MRDIECERCINKSFKDKGRREGTIEGKDVKGLKDKRSIEEREKQKKRGTKSDKLTTNKKRARQCSRTSMQMRQRELYCTTLSQFSPLWSESECPSACLRENISMPHGFFIISIFPPLPHCSPPFRRKKVCHLLFSLSLHCLHSRRRKCLENAKNLTHCVKCVVRNSGMDEML